MQEHPLILTLRLDAKSQAFFDGQRKLYFPPERNFLDAHLTLFHQLPDEPATYQYFDKLRFPSFILLATGLMNLSAGVAYRIDSPALQSLQVLLSKNFKDVLIPQDRPGFRPHIVIMNKSTPEYVRSLLTELSAGFEPFSFQATGLDLWTYLDGPWRHERSFAFIDELA